MSPTGEGIGNTTLVTVPLLFNGSQLQLNSECDPGGVLRVAILNASSGLPLAGEHRETRLSTPKFNLALETPAFASPFQEQLHEPRLRPRQLQTPEVQLYPRFSPRIFEHRGEDPVGEDLERREGGVASSDGGGSLLQFDPELQPRPRLRERCTYLIMVWFSTLVVEICIGRHLLALCV